MREIWQEAATPFLLTGKQVQNDSFGAYPADVKIGQVQRFLLGYAKHDCNACVIVLICTNSMSFEVR